MNFTFRLKVDFCELVLLFNLIFSFIIESKLTLINNLFHLVFTKFLISLAVLDKIVDKISFIFYKQRYLINSAKV